MRDLRIDHPDLGNNKLTLALPAFLGKPRIFFNDREIIPEKKTYSLCQSLGKTFKITLKNNGFDPIPKVFINDEAIDLVRPLKWYEYVWMGLPIALAFQGGAIGAVLGAFAFKINSSIFRSERNTVAKYLYSMGVSIIATAVFFVAAFFLNEAINGNQ